MLNMIMNLCITSVKSITYPILVRMIEFSLNKNTDVSLLIYNIRGEVVRQLVSDFYSTGVYQVEWDGRNNHGHQVASGIYFYRLKAGSFVKNKKMVFSK